MEAAFGSFAINSGQKAMLPNFFLPFELSWWFSGKESASQAGNKVLIPGLGRFPGEGNGNSIQYSCLGNAMDRGSWQATVHGVTRV